MKVALVAMPWSIAERPSAAVGALAAFVATEEPGYEVVSVYEYVHVARHVGFAGYGIIANEFYIGDLLYMPLLYPEKRESVRAHFISWLHKTEKTPADFGVPDRDWAEIFDYLQNVFAARLDVVADALSDSDVIGMTTCFGQLFPNLALAKRVRERSASARLVLGGSTVSSRVGPSLLAEYPWVDHMIQGEGERPFLAYLRTVASGGDDCERRLAGIRGIVARNLSEASNASIGGERTGDEGSGNEDGERASPERAGSTSDSSQGAAPAELWELKSLDDLPLPDFAPYVALAQKYGFDWRLPIEGSRGCWWDRTYRSKNPKATCYFCNLNVQWNGYRQKTVERLVDEVKTLSERYTNTQIFFLDNIIRIEEIEAMSRGLSALEKDLEYFYEMRANVHPYELMRLWESGLRGLQIGVEGLSTAYLRRIGKGTTAIQNLQVMKTCAELGISNASANLITYFPGSTAEEVRETVYHIRTFALAYEPCNVARFALGVDSTVDKRRDEFGIGNVRNSDWLRSGLPDEVWSRLQLFDLSYDDIGVTADWTEVEETCRAWRELWKNTPRPLLFYFDGGTFLRVIDRRAGRNGAHPVRLLTARSRAIYLYCMEIRSFDDIAARFEFVGDDKQRKLRLFLQQLVQWGLMFREKNKYLALALAPSPQAAARRLRNARAESAYKERRKRPGASALRVMP